MKIPTGGSIASYKNSANGDEVTHYVPPEPSKQQQWLADGTVIKFGDPVYVLRDGWKDKIGTYIGKDRQKRK